MSDKPIELPIEDLAHVAGGQAVAIGLMRGYVDALRGLHRTPNLIDGYMASGLRGNLPNSVTQKPRGWLGGQSINTITTPFRFYDRPPGFPLNRGSLR